MEIKALKWQFDDGGRARAGFEKPKARDCVVRAVAIAAGKPYGEVHAALMKESAVFAAFSRGRKAQYVKDKGPSPDRGVYREAYEPYLKRLGFKWVPCMRIGSGCKVHLCQGELPMGRLVVAVSRHLVAVVDGIVRDTHDPTRGGKRCVYGYYVAPAETKPRVQSAELRSIIGA